MTVIKDIWVNDIGTVFQARVLDGGAPMDLTLTSVKEIIFVKPDATLLVKDAAFVTDGVDGRLQYTTVDGDLDAAGTWSYYVHIIYPNGERRTSAQKFTVWS